MNEHTGVKTGHTVYLNDGLINQLETDQKEGLMRGVTLLSTLTYSKSEMALEGLKTSASIASTSHSFAKGGDDDTTVGSLIGDGVEAKVNKLLAKCWDKARDKVQSNTWLVRACDVLEVGLEHLLSWIKGLIFSGKVLAQVIPFYGNVKGIIDGALQVVETRRHQSAFEMLSKMGESVSSGISGVALNAFTTFAENEAIRCGLKSAWTFSKSIGGLLAEIFSFGAWKVVDFVIAIVEAISSFCFSLVQAVLFDKTTKKFGDYVEAGELPPVETFRTILSGCSFVGCVFFASSFYIGPVHMSSILSRSSRVLSSKTLTDTINNLTKARKVACKYTVNSSFKLSFRDGQSQQEFSWILKVIEGTASDEPKAEFRLGQEKRWDRYRRKFKWYKSKFG